MYKNKKEMMKLLLLIIIILALPLIFISIEFLYNIKLVSEINPDEIVTNTLDEIYESLNNLPKNNDSSTIRKCLTEIFELMNKRDYSQLYSLLTEDIKEHSFPTEENFIEYMESYLGENTYSPKFSEYEKLNKEEIPIFIVNVGFLPYSTDENDIITTSSPAMSDTFTIYMLDDSNYKFSFLSYIGYGSSNHTFNNDSMQCKIKKTHLYTSKTTFEIEFTNKIDSDIFVDKKGIYTTTGFMTKYYNSTIFIPANSTITTQYTIYTGFSLRDSLPNTLNFKGIHVNDTVYLFNLPIKYPIKLSSVHI